MTVETDKKVENIQDIEKTNKKIKKRIKKRF